VQINAQTTAIKPLKIAVFAPVYLDSAFNNSNYKLGNNNLPKNILPGLEFYNGVMLAVDSLNAEGIHAEGIHADLFFYDTKNSSEPISQILQKPELAGVSLIIASFNNRAEIKPLADFARINKIALISETYPNDGGISENPYFVLINATLRTHCEALYKFIQKNYAINNIVYTKKKGALEDMIQSFYTEMGKKTPAIPLKLKTVEIADTIIASELFKSLDSNRNNLIICGSLNEAFGNSLVKILSENKKYTFTVVGMPTWDSYKELLKPDYKGIEIIYSSPYNFGRTDNASIAINNKYKNRFSSRPSDQVFKGFEATYHFTKLLIKHQSAFINNLSDKSFKVFNDFDIQPIRFKRESTLADYLENKKIYFVKRLAGQIKTVN
jgi:ABC-type branched-subunit amino acid transport system substrate-binding protein